ncbi:hypothetical protein EYS39_04500 [Cronobacter sakazakii]|uniref:hypothetical protein n=1 Tax=Cronobacter sakazakii TaxID=28141 RepID=UPI00115E6AE6|nr:hypothetical protein [Cronobacter sakazakii]TQQ90950.1 hypothetical protein EYS39_04500 [Cronobacter sakazakii]
MNNDELIAAGHELAKCLDSNTPLLDIAKLLSKMASQLDVTTAALREKTKQCEQLAAENAALIESHKYVGLSPKYNEAAMMEMKRPFIDELIHSSEYYSVCGHISAATNRAIKAVHDDYSWLPETPATDAFLREVRAQGVDAAIEQLHKKFSETGRIGVPVMALEHLADQLRQGGAA